RGDCRADQDGAGRARPEDAATGDPAARGGGGPAADAGGRRRAGADRQERRAGPPGRAVNRARCRAPGGSLAPACLGLRKNRRDQRAVDAASRRRRAHAKLPPSSGSSTAAAPNSAAAPAASTTSPARATPTACPRNRQEANQATAVPRALGTIWVACVCSVACSK